MDVHHSARPPSSAPRRVGRSIRQAGIRCLDTIGLSGQHLVDHYRTPHTTSSM